MPIADIIFRIRAEYRQAGKVLKASQEDLKGMTTQGGKLKKNLEASRTTLGKFLHATRVGTHGLRGFRMEMLGVLFFGMAIQKFFFGLLKPAAQAAGIFDLISNILAILFLPIILALLPYILKFGEFLIGLSEPIKIAIGVFVLIMGIFGAFIMFLGMLVLGIGSVMIVIAGGWVPLLVAVLVPAILTIIAAVIGFIGWIIAMRKEGKSWGEIFKAIWTKVKTVVVWAVKGMWSIVKLVFKGIWKLIQTVSTWIVDIISKWLSEKTKQAWIRIAEHFHNSFIVPVQNWFANLINWIVDKINGLIVLFNKVSGRFGITIPTLGHVGLMEPTTTTITSAPTINVTAPPAMNLDALVSEISNRITSELGNVTRR